MNAGAGKRTSLAVALALIGGLEIAAAAGAASEWLAVCGKCISPTIFAKSGVGTANARAEARITRAEIEDWCANWQPGDGNCVPQQLKSSDLDKVYRASADCPGEGSRRSTARPTSWPASGTTATSAAAAASGAMDREGSSAGTMPVADWPFRSNGKSSVRTRPAGRPRARPLPANACRPPNTPSARSSWPATAGTGCARGSPGFATAMAPLVRKSATTSASTMASAASSRPACCAPSSGAPPASSQFLPHPVPLLLVAYSPCQ